MEGDPGEREEFVTCKLCTAASHLRFRVKEYIQRIKLFHAHQMNFRIICGISGCKRTYTNPGSFYNHVYAVYDERSNDTCKASVINEESLDCNEDSDGYSTHDDGDDDDNDLTDPDMCDSQQYFSTESLQKFSAIFC